MNVYNHVMCNNDWVNDGQHAWPKSHKITSSSDTVAMLVCVSRPCVVCTITKSLPGRFSEHIPYLKWLIPFSPHTHPVGVFLWKLLWIQLVLLCVSLKCCLFLRCISPYSCPNVDILLFFNLIIYGNLVHSDNILNLEDEQWVLHWRKRQKAFRDFISIFHISPFPCISVLYISKI